MSEDTNFEIFLVAAPGLEGALCAEARSIGYKKAKTVEGGVVMRGGWADVWRANLDLRGASRVLARIGDFRVVHLAQLDKRARSFPWGNVLRRDVPFRVEASCTASRIYHSGAATERIERAISEELGAPVSAEAQVAIKARIDGNVCTIAIDTSGEGLHKRGHKLEVNRAPMRETLAALFLRQCGYDGREPVVDPMCGSGTFPIEAAEIAAGLRPGRSRRFAFEQLATFDANAWRVLRERTAHETAGAEPPPALRFYGSDRDAGAFRMSRANAERAGVAGTTEFHECGIDSLAAPMGPPGLVIINPPYGDRIGDKAGLAPLYRELGQTLTTRFSGWRVGLITSEEHLAKATGLPFILPSPPVLNGGLRITLYRTGPLP